MIVILLGPPGVGKGTQGKLLCDEMNLEHLSTGDLLRAARRDGTDLGKQAQAYMDKGELVPDEVIVGMVREKLADLGADTGVVFDGFPRTVPQAEALEEVLADLDVSLDRVILLEADDEVLVKRLSGRRTCPQCGEVFNIHFDPPEEDGVCDRCGTELVHRRDDAPETVRNRLEVYRELTQPLVEFYEESETTDVVRIDGDRPVEEVQNSMCAAVAEAG